jgi:hypothetical protein
VSDLQIAEVVILCVIWALIGFTVGKASKDAERE